MHASDLADRLRVSRQAVGQIGGVQSARGQRHQGERLGGPDCTPPIWPTGCG
ncbi:hypothetical protein MAHJHV51_54980 [Mycobacterium avium subsp. hominissuis]